jgi:hypothetical protein
MSTMPPNTNFAADRRCHSDAAVPDSECTVALTMRSTIGRYVDQFSCTLRSKVAC